MRLVGGKLSVQEEVLSVVLDGGNPSVLDDTLEEIDGGTADVLGLQGGKRDLVGDILEFKLEYVEKTSFSIDLVVDGDDGALLDQVVSVDDEKHTEIWARVDDMGTGRDAAEEEARAGVKSLISLSLDSIFS